MLLAQPGRDVSAAPPPTHIDSVFSVSGERLPADHNYGLYAALSKLCPAIHNEPRFAVQTIAGIPDRQGKIALAPWSKLRLRLPSESLPKICVLAGKQLTIGSHAIRLGNPQIQLLRPADTLWARLVTIKGYQEPEEFLGALDRQMAALGIRALAGIPSNESGQPKRLTLRIKRYTVVGFSVVMAELSPKDSIRLQTEGLGGKRRMGCGVFVRENSILSAVGGDRHANTN
ncbi:MAG: type I-MYXAN CRISPR-associated protein Cas6/Cmx6 [Spirulinaceae cyanobacterium SM2_1_0]|nr:type I-MYXAN CRISPR-associated protein Cas6/Cmx6 [Spirulinaceae cyanobacterium SM2_1_0]